MAGVLRMPDAHSVLPLPRTWFGAVTNKGNPMYKIKRINSTLDQQDRIGNLQYFKYPFSLSLIMLSPMITCLVFPEYYKLVFSVTVFPMALLPHPHFLSMISCPQSFLRLSLLPKSSLFSFLIFGFFKLILFLPILSFLLQFISLLESDICPDWFF